MQFAYLVIASMNIDFDTTCVIRSCKGNVLICAGDCDI